MKSLLAALLAALALLAAGCSGEPSDADIRSALEKDMAKTAQSINKTTQMFGGAGKALSEMMKTEIHAVKKIGCVESKDSPGYVCDFEVDMTAPVTGRGKETAKARFVKGPEGWVVVK